MFQLAGGDVTLSPNLNYYGQQYFSPFNAKNVAGSAQQNAELQQGEYTLVSASLAWKRDRYLVRAWVDNLTDEHVLGYGLDLRGAGFPYNFLVPASPRTFGAELRVSF
jgi:outer membrane receptor protein involved in Fe transport